jgi:hypothetical protein
MDQIFLDLLLLGYHDVLMWHPRQTIFKSYLQHPTLPKTKSQQPTLILLQTQIKNILTSKTSQTLKNIINRTSNNKITSMKTLYMFRTPTSNNYSTSPYMHNSSQTFRYIEREQKMP